MKNKGSNLIKYWITQKYDKFLNDFRLSNFQKGQMAAFSEKILKIGLFCIESCWFECQMTSKMSVLNIGYNSTECCSIFKKVGLNEAKF